MVEFGSKQANICLLRAGFNQNRQTKEILMKNLFNRSHQFIRDGFVPKIQSSQKFNVLCVTKYELDFNGRSLFHQSIGAQGHAEIEVKQVLYTRKDFSFTQTLVEFAGQEYLFEGLRNGLGGSCLVIGIFKDDDNELPVWHFYTDTPSGKPDRDGEVVTSEQIRSCALQEIERIWHYA